MAAAIPYVIGGVTSLIGGGIGSSAAKSAAAQQSASIDKGISAIQGATDKTLPMLQQMYQQGSAGYQPYQNMGTQGTSRLSTLLGFTPQNMGGQPAAMSAPTQGMSGQTLGGMAQPSGMVMVQSPDGETRQVPEAQAQFYAKRGAKILGGGGGSGPGQPMPKAW